VLDQIEELRQRERRASFSDALNFL